MLDPGLMANTRKEASAILMHEGVAGINSAMFPLATDMLGRGPGRFNPNSIPNMTLWLDGNDPRANGIPPANGTTLSAWNDKSVAGINFAQSSGALQPTFNTNQYNTLGSVVSSGNKWMQSASNVKLNGSNITMLCAGKPVNNGNFAGLFTSRKASNPLTGYLVYAVNGTTNWQGWTGNSGASWNIATDGTINYSVSAVISMRATGGTATWYVNGVTFGTTAYTPNITDQQFLLSSNGGTFGFVGAMNELIIYNDAISDAQLSAVTSYLVNRWGA